MVQELGERVEGALFRLKPSGALTLENGSGDP